MAPPAPGPPPRSHTTPEPDQGLTEEPSPPLLALPDALLTLVASHLAPADKKAARLTCRTLRAAASAAVHSLLVTDSNLRTLAAPLLPSPAPSPSPHPHPPPPPFPFPNLTHLVLAHSPGMHAVRPELLTALLTHALPHLRLLRCLDVSPATRDLALGRTRAQLMDTWRHVAEGLPYGRPVRLLLHPLAVLLPNGPLPSSGAVAAMAVAAAAAAAAASGDSGRNGPGGGPGPPDAEGQQQEQQERVQQQQLPLLGEMLADLAARRPLAEVALTAAPPGSKRYDKPRIPSYGEVLATALAEPSMGCGGLGEDGGGGGRRGKMCAGRALRGLVLGPESFGAVGAAELLGFGLGPGNAAPSGSGSSDGDPLSVAAHPAGPAEATGQGAAPPPPPPGPHDLALRELPSRVPLGAPAAYGGGGDAATTARLQQWVALRLTAAGVDESTAAAAVAAAVAAAAGGGGVGTAAASLTAALTAAGCRLESLVLWEAWPLPELLHLHPHTCIPFPDASAPQATFSHPSLTRTPGSAQQFVQPPPPPPARAATAVRLPPAAGCLAGLRRLVLSDLQALHQRDRLTAAALAPLAALPHLTRLELASLTVSAAATAAAAAAAAAAASRAAGGGGGRKGAGSGRRGGRAGSGGVAAGRRGSAAAAAAEVVPLPQVSLGRGGVERQGCYVEN